MKFKKFFISLLSVKLYIHSSVKNNFTLINVVCLKEQHYLELKQRVLNYDMLIDKLITKDVQLTACNDDQYFVFEDVLYQVPIPM